MADSPTSQTLLQRLRGNDGDAWRTMVQLYTPLVCHWCQRGGVTGADADDVVQEVFQAASTCFANFRRDRPGDSFRGWLRGITKNMILMHFRRRGRQPQAAGGTDAFRKLHEIADGTPDTDDDDPGAELDALHRRALELVKTEFAQRTWQMFWLTAIEDRSPVDIAAAMGVSPTAVRMAKSRVLHRLREAFGDLVE